MSERDAMRRNEYVGRFGDHSSRYPVNDSHPRDVLTTSCMSNTTQGISEEHLMKASWFQIQIGY